MALIFASAGVSAQTLLFVSEYGTGNLRAFDFSGAPVGVPTSYTPISGSAAGADGMVTGPDGRLYVNRDGGAISLRSLDGQTFSTFTTIGGSPILLDLTRNSTHLFAARYGFPTIYQVSLLDGTSTALPSPSGMVSADGVRIGPDGRLYAVDSSDGRIFAFNLNTSTWDNFLTTPPTTGIASQMEFDGNNVFVSRTIGGQARIYRYALNTPGDYAAGLNPASETLIGSFGSSTATGIRIGPDGRLYANAFNSGEIWRSNVGITAMDDFAFITGLDEPGSVYFTAIPEPSTTALLLLVLAVAAGLRRRR